MNVAQEPKKSLARRLFDRWAQSRRLAPGEQLPEGPYFVGRGPFIALLCLAVIGTFAAGYLSYRHVLLVSQSDSVGNSMLCRPSGKINCDAILLTEYATFLQGYVSSAALGLMGMTFLLWCVVNGLVNERVRKLAWICLAIYLFSAIGFSTYYVIVMIFDVSYLCTWCMVVHAVNLIALITVFWIAVKKRRHLLVPEISTFGERSYFVVGGLALSLFVFCATSLAERSLSFNDAKRRFEELANDPVVILAVLQASETYEVPTGSADPVYGKTDAPFRLVLFADFECPICDETDLFLKKLVAANKDLLHLVFKNYPLSNECNKAILDAGQFHPYSCEAARAAHAAFIMGGPGLFTKYGDLLFKNRRKLDNKSWTKFAEELKMDVGKFGKLMEPGSDADKKVNEDVELGVSLSIASTPQLFFEGKKIPINLKGEFLISVLERLVRVNHPEKGTVSFKRPVSPETP
ncbi:MAG: vitamin K epoxide reductase family protein [Thermodesulfobacteriota bacterium]